MRRLLHDLLDQNAVAAPNSVALRYSGQDTAYADLQAQSLRIATGLHARGIGRGDRVLIHLPNRPESVQLALACSRLGAIFVPVPPILKIRQLHHIMQDSGATCIATTVGSLSQVMAAAHQCDSLRMLITVDATNNLDVGSQFVLTSLSDLMSKDAALSRSSRAIDRDPAAIFYTSGSTGKSKGVVVSHQNLVSGASCVAEYLHNVPTDRILCALPLSFDYGFSQVSTALLSGGCAVLTHYSLPAALVRELVTERITGLAGVPTIWLHLLDVEWPPEPLSHLRYITNSGGALSAVTIKSLRARLPNTRIFCMYGLTEAFRSTYLDPDLLDTKLGSMGRAIPNQEVLVLRPDGTRCDIGEPGELIHRGSLVALGYWNDAERTAHRFRPVPPMLGGAPSQELAVWSGDRVRMDEDGCLYFMTRMDQQIKTSGYRVSPDEIQDVILEVPGVLEAVAVGLEDEKLGQRIAVALIATRNAPQDLIEQTHQQCRKQLPPYMVPTDIRLVESIPRTTTGKPDRAELAELLRRRDRARLSLVADSKKGA